MRVIAIDPAIRNTGFAVVEGDALKQRALAYHTIRIPQRLPQRKALAAVRTGIANQIEKWQPDEVAVESIIFVQSHRTAISMGAARAATLIAAADRGLPIYEYAPRRVKQAVVGKGAADKGQVAFMVRALLSLSETPDPDAADALAIALAHFYGTDPLKAKSLEKKAI